MAKNKSKPLPKFGSLDKLVEFFDTNDLGDFLDAMPEAHFDIDLKLRFSDEYRPYQFGETQ